MPDSFSTQQYPTVEETLVNNALLLYKQKRQFLADLRSLMGTLALVLIGLVYLRDVSLVLLVLRAIVHFFLSNLIASLVHYGMLREGARHEQRLFLLWTTVAANATAFLSHLFFGVYSASKDVDHRLHGGFTVQFIGERLPRLRWEVLAYDVAIFLLQLLYFCLMCATDDLEVLENPRAQVLNSDETVLLDTLSDGYNGNVTLLMIDVWAAVRDLWAYERTPTEAAGPDPGSLRRIALRELTV